MIKCHLLKQKSSSCCLKLFGECEHGIKHKISDYNWKNKSIILSVKYPTTAIHSFIIPLRSSSIDADSLNPIIIVLENE